MLSGLLAVERKGFSSGAWTKCTTLQFTKDEAVVSQLQPKIWSTFRFWINCVFYPKPESRWKQQLQFASGISFIMFPIKWLWLWVYPILKQTQLWPSWDFPWGCWMRNIKSWNCDSSENRPGKGGSMGSMLKGWIAARIRRNLLLYLDYVQVSCRPSLPLVDPIFYWWHSRSYCVLAQPKTNQILYPLILLMKITLID